MQKLSFFGAITVIFFSLTGQSYGALSVQDVFRMIKEGVKSSDAEALCSQGKLLKGEFSIRAGNGELCKIKEIGLFGELYCPAAAPDYNTSQCHQKAMVALATPLDPQNRNDPINTLSDQDKRSLCAQVARTPAGSVARKYLHPLCAN